MSEKNSAEEMAKDPFLRSRLYLVSKGIPFDIAFLLETDEALAYAVILGEFEGGNFNWDRMRWEENN